MADDEAEKSLWELFKEFLQDTTLHGAQYLGADLRFNVRKWVNLVTDEL